MDQEKKEYTIEDIARELGVSKTTVSRALSGKGRIGRETVERVQAFAKQHDYRPNVVARGLAQNKTYNLGLALPREGNGEHVPFFNACMDGICEAAARFGYDVIIAMRAEDNIRQMERLVSNHKVDGMILTRAVINSATVKFLKECQVPLVLIGPSEDLEIVSIDNPNREASRELTGFLLMKGLRRLALVGGSSQYYVTESRRQGFLDAHRDKGMTSDERLEIMDVSDYRKALRAVEQALTLGADGMVCMDDGITGMVLGALREKGVEVPAMMKLASLYDSYQMEHNLPPVTSVRFDTRGLGRNACLRMLEMLGEDTRNSQYGLNYQVILRESTK